METLGPIVEVKKADLKNCPFTPDGRPRSI
ncbi:uncharacterized protein METZ01_LOCUS217636, partial [marine metagenome]